MDFSANFSIFLNENINRPTYSRICWYSLQFSLRVVLQWAALKAWEEMPTIPDMNADNCSLMSLTSIPLGRDRRAQLMTYQSAIALNLAHSWCTPVIPLAECIASNIRLVGQFAHIDHNFCQNHLTLASRRVNFSRDSLPLSTFLSSVSILTFLDGLELSVQTNGYLQFQCSAQAISAWLQSLLDGESRVSFFPQSPTEVSRRFYPEVSVLDDTLLQERGQTLQPEGLAQDTIPFELVLVHARCCSLLRMAHRLDQITLQIVWPTESPNSPFNATSKTGWIDVPGGLQRPDSLRRNDRSTHDLTIRPPWKIVKPSTIFWDQLLPCYYRHDGTYIGECCSQSSGAYSLLVCLVETLDQYAHLQLHSESERRATETVIQARAKVIALLCCLSQSFQEFERQFAVAFRSTELTLGRGRRKRRSRSCPPHSWRYSSHQAQLGLICIIQKMLACFLSELVDQSGHGHPQGLIPDEL